MLSKNTIQFLRDLAENNNREWFQANKAAFEAAKDDFATFLKELIAAISDFDDELVGTRAADCVFRIYRDVRFSKDKSPYKTAFGAYMANGGRKSMAPGYYLHVEPDKCFIAGGAYHPDPASLFKIRMKIATDTDEFFAITGEKSFKKTFSDVEAHNDALANVPKGFAKDHAAAEYLKFKNFIASCEIGESELADAKKIAAKFKTMKPLSISFGKQYHDKTFSCNNYGQHF